jgi:hypothetical protein
MKALSLDKIRDKSKTNNSTSRTNNLTNENPTVFSTDNSKIYLLPPLKRDLFKKSLMQQNSVLSKYIGDFVSNYIKSTKELTNFNSESNSKKASSKRSSINSNDIKTIKSNIKIKNEKNLDSNSPENNILCLSERSANPIINKRNSKIINKKLLYITEFRNKKKEISPQTSFTKNKSPIKVNKNTFLKKSTPNINIIFSSGNETYIPKSIDIDQQLSLQDLKRLQKFFRRKKTYQPNILSDWKEKIGLNVKTIKKNYISEFENDVTYQSKIFKDQINLLEGNIKYFNKNFVGNLNFLKAFNSLVLKTKINFNKALEETIGIIYLLPQLILSDFYQVINRFNSIKIPDNNKFVEKYVFDEFDNLKYNCDLLKEVSDFFNSCFDVYLILINEVDDMNLNFENFNNIISSFEKARYNMIYVINAATNAIKYYDKDMNFINKFNNKMGIKKKIIQRNMLSNKIMNQFMFKKNPERQKKLMIDSCLSEVKREDKEKQEINFSSYFNKKRKNHKFKSLVNTKLVKNLLKNCSDEAKNIINTEIINDQMSGDFSDEEEILVSKRKVIKIDV